MGTSTKPSDPLICVCQHDNVQEPSRRRECSAPRTGRTQGVRPVSDAAQRTASLPDAADGYTLTSCTKSTLSSQQALPAPSLKCRFRLSSPSTIYNPAGTSPRATRPCC
ncbi:hypothetical protein SNOG_04255 [Parastagonospora nodorum SN15]|uniref:Uncharacterized protein n=1 Tax=Phaeosphaeria nodorum (strain SN15 / ATCC MYA-4574 / FGSC 10173) TaxID=321614 RepID=Q0UVF9_PHANO|nr:hypothetical protein SNOG_04255 [Parastagonospora nodorum SN15]EAT88015.1 hypothetical protein SNOG_04255 [Parastagonospora nodorum SN15]